MRIEFLERHQTNSDSGITIFWAKVDDKTVQCTVTDEALQDYIPSNATEKPEDLFKSYRADIENIAQKKIMASEFNGGKVQITTEDLKYLS